jgi:hypothetical protein
MNVWLIVILVLVLLFIIFKITSKILKWGLIILVGYLIYRVINSLV